MYTLNTKLSEFVEQGLKKNGGCPEPIAWGNGLVKQNSKITMANAIEIGGANQGWADWILRTFDGQFDSGLKKELLKCIKDPMAMFQLFITLKDLDNDDEKLIKKQFQGKLPTAEHELSCGIVKQQKNGNN
jgi:hypothetical protein